MPWSTNIRYRLLAIIILGLIILGLGAVKLRRWQSQRNIENSMVEGLAAFDRQDWPKAARLLGRYVGRNIERCSDPEVATICRQFAEAHLSIQPPQAATISTAISTYRRLLRDGEFDIAICERLAFLYQATGDLIELQYTADRLAEYEPTNPLVAFWRAQAAIGKNDSESAISELGALIQRLEGEPNRTAEYVRACVMMASIDSVKQSGRARTWLDRAITRDPKSADPRLARARLLRNLARFQPTAARAELFEAAQQDLTVAMQFPSASAMTRLGLSEELRLRGQFDLAESQIRLARELPLEQVKDYYLDVSDWRVDCGIQSIRIKTSQGKIAEAATEAQELLGGLSAPHNRLEVLPMAVELLATTDRVAAARELLNEYKEMVPVVDLQTDARHAHLEASVLLAEGLPYRVIDRLEPYLQSRNFTDSMRGLLAEAFRRTRQQGRIAALYRSDSTGAIEGPIPALMTIEAMLRGGHIEEAARVLGELERLNPNSIELQLLRMDIDLLMAAQDKSDGSNAVRQACESKLRELLRSRTNEQEVRSRLALLIAADGRVDEGEQLLKQAIADDPDSQDPLLNLARFYSLCNMRREALATLRKTIDLFPSSAQPRLELADLLLLGQDREAARQILAAALDAVSADLQSNISRRLAAIELADDSTNASGMQRMKQLAEADPQDIEARSLLLQSSAFRSDSVAAQKAIEEIKAIEGESGQRWRYHQAQLDLDGMTDVGGAEQQALRQGIEDMLMMCINRDPAWSQPVLLLGAYYERLDLYEKAEQLYRRSLDASPDSAVAGQLLLQLETRHRFKEALNVMDRYPAVFNAPEFGARRLTIAMDSGDSDLISRQLEFQSGRNAQDPQILILSAMLTFSRNRDVAEAQRILQSALDAGADPLTVASTRVGILKGAGQINEAKRILDDMVTATPTFEVRLLRGAFLDSIGDVSAAEADYKELPLLSSDVRGFAHLTDFYAEKKRFDEAVATIDAGLDKYPEALDLKRGLLKILLTRRSPDDLSRAESVIGTIDSNTMDTDLLWVQTVLVEHKGGADAAQSVRHLLERAAQHPKASLEVYRGLVNTALRMKETSLAEKLLDAAGREHGEYLPALNVMRAYLMIARGEALLSLGYLRQARVRGRYDFSAYECLLALTPYLANSVALGEFLDPLEAALAQFPNDERLRIIHARLLQHQGRSREAAEQLAAWFKSKESSPQSDTRILLTLVDLFAASGNIKEAEANLERLMAIDPKPAAVRAARINLLALQSQYDEISKIGVEILDDESLSKTERLNLAFQAAQLLSLSNDASRIRLALAAYQRIAAQEPKSVSAALGIAICFGQLGEIDDAIRSYRMAIEYDPNRDEALNNLAWLLTTEKNNAAEAVEFASRAVELKPEEPAYRDTLGEILQRLPNRLSDAVDQFARASDLYGHSDAKRAHSLLKMAVVCHRLQRDGEAKRYLEAARRIDAASRIESQTGALSESDRATLNQLARELNPASTQSLDSMAP